MMCKCGQCYRHFATQTIVLVKQTGGVTAFTQSSLDVGGRNWQLLRDEYFPPNLKEASNRPPESLHGEQPARKQELFVSF